MGSFMDNGVTLFGIRNYLIHHGMNKEEKKSKIVEMELWDHYSELPNPSWYEYKDKEKEDDI